MRCSDPTREVADFFRQVADFFDEVADSFREVADFFSAAPARAVHLSVTKKEVGDYLIRLTFKQVRPTLPGIQSRTGPKRPRAAKGPRDRPFFPAPPRLPAQANSTTERLKKRKKGERPCLRSPISLSTMRRTAPP